VNEREHLWEAAAINQNRAWLLRYFLAGTGDMSAAEDLCQDVLIIAYEKRATFVAGMSFGAWLRGIARNRLKQYYGQNRHRALLSDRGMAILDTIAASVESEYMDANLQKRRLAALRECLKTLRDTARRVLLMRYGERKKGKAIALALGIEPQRVNWLAFSARRALFACIEKAVKS
jgi:RNA polymerase sigma-70 factor (ECF subfamily)